VADRIAAAPITVVAAISAEAVAISAAAAVISAGAAIRPAENSSAADQHEWFGRADVRPNIFKPHLFVSKLGGSN
jgi:hypothetical protein